MIEPETEVSVSRIKEISAAARAAWLTFLGYIAFSTITILSVTDADFFIDSRRTQLPLVGIDIATRDFFIFGPALGAALCLYLHFYLLKLWHALAAPPLNLVSSPLSEAVPPWLVNDLGLAFRKGSRPTLPVADAVTIVTTGTLVFIAGPTLISAFWIRYWPAHDFSASLIGGALVFLCMTVSGYSAIKAVQELRYPGLTQRPGVRMASLALGVLLLVALTAVTEIKTNGDAAFSRLIRFAGIESRWLTLSKADLAGVELVSKPSTWKSYENHFAEFRALWCSRNGLPSGACGSGDPRDVNGGVGRVRDLWCADNEVAVEVCGNDFKRLEQRFRSEWIFARTDHLQGLPLLDLRGRDLRNADLSYAFLPGADLRGARIDGARIDGAHAEYLRLDATTVRNVSAVGADLRHARLHRAPMHEVDFTDANLMLADLSGDAFSQVEASHLDFQGANLVITDLSGRLMSDARFFDTTMIETDFSNSMLTDVDLSREVLVGVDLGGATISLGDLWYSVFSNVDFTNSTFQSSLIDNARFENPNFYYTRFANSIINNTRFVGLNFPRSQWESSANWDFGGSISYFPNTGAPAIESCWAEEPRDFEALIDLRVRHDAARVVDDEVRRSSHRRNALCSSSSD